MNILSGLNNNYREVKSHSFHLFNELRLGGQVSDEMFDAIYPEYIQNLSDRHWTPVKIAKLACEYLTAYCEEAKVLDIGSGCGKFCLVGAATTKAHFYGVEQRANLVEISNSIAIANGIHNAEFIHDNIAAVSFSEYDAFYFYNSFFENINSSSVIDNDVMRIKALYFQYSKYVHDQLYMLPKGTKLVTFWSICNEVPENYDIESIDCNGKLIFWKKIY